jgi:predicted amidohydrolase
MLRKGGEIFNTLLLAAPNGRTWEYDKLNPWGWERAYFRPGNGIVVAETDLGRLGFLICWDVGFPRLFRAYAGTVQMLIISSCPPRLNHLEIDFMNGRTAAIADISFLVGANRTRGDTLMNEDLRAQGAWLGVPLVNAMHHGMFSSPVPRPGISLAASLLLNPRYWHLLPHARGAVICAPQNEHTLVAAADGQELARAGEGDTFALAQVEIPDEPPHPTGPQPKMGLHPSAYAMHKMLNWIVKPLYDQNVRRRPN